MTNPNPHPTDEALALYVMDALDADLSGALEAHVALCAPCGARLAQEAKLEISLAQVGAAQPLPSAIEAPSRSRSANLRWGFAAAASLLLALGGARLISSRGAIKGPITAQSSFSNIDAGALATNASAAQRNFDTAVACLDSRQLEECLKSSRAQGLLVQLPAQPVPKYEELALDAPHPTALSAWRPLVEGE